MSDGLGFSKEHRTVSRVTSILEAVAAAPDGVRLANLASLLSAPKSSVFGLVKGLVANGYLIECRGIYYIGPAVFSLLTPPKISVVEQAKPIMKKIHSVFNETVTLSARAGSSLVYIDSCESSHLIRYATPFRLRRPLYPTSSGKCFLAFAEKGFSDEYLEKTLADRDALSKALDEIAQVKKNKMAFNFGETLSDVSAVSVPVFKDGQVMNCISVAGPSERITNKLEEIGEMLKHEIGNVFE